jgi:hypothetical protein
VKRLFEMVAKKYRQVMVQVYIPVYDVQGDSILLPVDVNDRASWSAFKQELISKFIDQFDGNFQKRYHKPLDEFGKGKYKNNAMNRRLDRVGVAYDKAIALKQRLTSLVHNRNFIIKGEQEFFDTLSRKWTGSDDSFVRDMRAKGLTYKQIGARLFRSSSSISSRVYRQRKRSNK